MIVAVLVGIFFAATGRGGEMAYEHADYAPLDLGPVSAADVALLRPPTAMWGYNMQVTDEALDHIARAMRERDVTIACLQEQLAGLAGGGSGAERGGAFARSAPGSPEAPEVQPFPEAAEITGPAGHAEAAEIADRTEPAETDEPSEIAKLTDILATSRPAEPLDPAEPLQPAEDTRPEALPVPSPPRTPLVLKASGAKAPPAPEPHGETQPNETLQDPGPHETTQPNETLPSETQPSEAPPPHGHGAHGPQGGYDTHGWWAEQKEAAREEALRQAAAEEQGW